MYINPDLYIFEGLTSDEVNYFALMCEPMDFNAGAIVLREGDESDGRAYFIEEGEAEVIQNGKILTLLKVGDIFGEIALITNDPRSASIRAKSNLQALALHRNDFLMLAKKSGRFPEIQKEVFRRIRENFSK
jgi:CRP-like cAMP-binding protein